MIKRMITHGWVFFMPLLSLAANPSDLEKLVKREDMTQHGLDLSQTDLRHYVFTPDKIDLQHANLSNSNLAGVNLSKMNLAHANLSHANLAGATLREANLADATLDYANLSGADLTQADLSNTNFSHADLSRALLLQTRINKTNFTCANLNSANFSRAAFGEAIISGASFINTLTTDVTGYTSVIDGPASC